MGTRLGYITCSEKYKTYLEKWELYALVTEGQRAPQGTPPTDADVADCVHQTALRGNALYKDALKGAETPKSKAAFSEYMVAWDSCAEVHPQAGSRDRPAVPRAPEAGGRAPQFAAGEARGFFTEQLIGRPDATVADGALGTEPRQAESLRQRWQPGRPVDELDIVRCRLFP